MPLAVKEKHMQDVLVLSPQMVKDERGFFMETFRSDQFRQWGVAAEFVQDNHSYSRKGVIRGLHFQWNKPMGKLMRVTRGTAFLVAVDIRKGSPTLGQWFGIEASEENLLTVWAPAGFARGFCALTDDVEVQYKCTALYNPVGEAAICWNDSRIGIRWPVDNPILSGKDRNAPTLDEWLARPEADMLAFARAS